LQFGESLFFSGEDYLIGRLFIHNLADCLFVGKGAGYNCALESGGKGDRLESRQMPTRAGL
jgi:hypothetical protein